MNALYFLFVFWLLPAHMVMAVMAERIARAKGLSSADYFVRTLFLGFPSLVSLVSLEGSHDSKIFATATAQRMLEWTLIWTGCPLLAMTVILFGYCLPIEIATVAAFYGGLLLLAWFVFSALLIPAWNIYLLRGKKTLTWRDYALACLAQSLGTTFWLDEATNAEEGLSNAEFAILRALLIPATVPCAVVNFLGVIALIALFIAFLITTFREHYIDIPFVVMTACTVIGGLAALAVSPLACYLMARRKGRSVALWTPIGFVAPVVSPLLLSFMKSPDLASGKEPANPACNDWTTLIVIHAQAVLVPLFLMSIWPLFQWNVSFTAGSAVFALIPAWMVFACIMPFGATKIMHCLKHGSSSLSEQMLIRAAGCESACFFVALLLSWIRFVLHAKYL